ncbi:hypothetical protein DJ568_04615 [Mucilaginibacter hurinus]|uniref:DUF4177 domain-containing protein n=1 Tax=Mucilaginibacter hurinus TaxID=2201324 RepID=A0A367GSG3_9SPHI|nr:hypothetical protein [Mucilaginibacter hurinus]RCH56035.1 hypothetical protein DJ568_04615 [Mucilaginibacter hurinus]
MKKLLLIVLLTIPVYCFAQTEAAAQKPAEQYCMIISTPKLFSKKVTIEVDFGQPTKFFSDTRLKDEAGKVVSFNSTIDALNYMAGQGWIFVNAYAVATQSTTGNTTQTNNILHYMMRRPVTN